MTKEGSQKINMGYLSDKAHALSRFIRFEYKNEQIKVIIDTIKLDKHYLYYMVDLLEMM